MFLLSLFVSKIFIIQYEFLEHLQYVGETWDSGVFITELSNNLKHILSVGVVFLGYSGFCPVMPYLKAETL